VYTDSVTFLPIYNPLEECTVGSYGIAIAIPEIIETTNTNTENLAIPKKLSAYEELQLLLLKELGDDIANRSKFLPIPETDEEFKKRHGWY
jgi:hypothetical protein